MDIYGAIKRSEIMSKISGKETKPEIIVRRYLHSNGFRFIKNDRRLPGKPDIVLPKFKTAVFVHGCFWHGHDCKSAKLPQTRKEFWERKINDTKKRDARNLEHLKELGWGTIIIWECELKNQQIRNTRMKRLITQIFN